MHLRIYDFKLYEVLGCLLIFIFCSIMMFLLIKIVFDFVENNFNYETYYIDLENNEGKAKFCDKDMSCVTFDDKRILVKEYWKERVD